MNHADMIEEFIVTLRIKYMHWMFEGNTNAEVTKFVEWVIKDEEKALHTPRGKDGKSFFQRREEENENNKSG